jgi:hypothetical protein
MWRNNRADERSTTAADRHHSVRRSPEVERIFRLYREQYRRV